MNIRLFKPSIGEQELINIKDVFDRSWLGLGPKVHEFEDKWSRYIGCKESIAVNSATAALHLSLTAFRFEPGKKVLVPDITFASTATAVLCNQLVPVFVDVDAGTVNMSLDDLKKKYTKDCVAIIPVHYGGQPMPMDKLMKFAKSKNLVVIEDCAHCAGGSYKGKKLGTWGNIGCFSFEEKKCMTTGDGGMICSNDEKLVEPLRAYRWVGIDKETWKRREAYTDTRNRNARHWYYEISVLGYKYNMNDIAAAIGLAQLEKLDRMNVRRGEIVAQYQEGLLNLESIRPLLPYEPHNYVYWIFGVRCTKRDDLLLFMKSKGIATGVHYMPLTLHPLFREYDTGCPVSKRIWKTFLTLPLHADLTDSEVMFILNALEQFDQK